ncbi:YdcF family protein [Nocardia yamanashiensis]|uniref:YdcF family protein n=1 Tax=Nocardia yamanashiensis TaxID=209247 RepID=UPI00082F99BE|nr:YdcF family protein [Nocardia yamanashiensis]
MPLTTLPEDLVPDIETLWHYNQLRHEVRPVDAAIGLGSHDLGVADQAIKLYHKGFFPLIVFTGATAPTTIERFPRGEAQHYSEWAIAGGVPPEAILVEPNATNTTENINFTRALLAEHGTLGSVKSVMLISRPYQQRRSYAICRKQWPEVDVVCAPRDVPLDYYIDRIGDIERVITMLVGDTQRVWVYADNGWAIEQEVPDEVRQAYSRLVDAGFTDRLLPE